MKKRVPVGKEEGDEKEGVEEDVEDETPSHELRRHHRVDYTLALCFIGLVSELEAVSLKTLVSRFLMGLSHIC